MVIVDGGGARVVRARVGPDHALAQVGELEPLVAEVALHQLDHRPLEQQPSRLGVVPQASLDGLAGG